MKEILDILDRIGDNGAISERIFLTLREAIVKGIMKAGERIKEESISELFQVSRTPVREALKKLQAEGLIVNNPGIGLIITELTTEDAINLYVVSEVLQGASARIAAERATKPHILLLEQKCNEIESLIPNKDYIKATELNYHFHMTIAQSSGNKYLTDILYNVLNKIKIIRPSTFSTEERWSKINEEHRMILMAIKMGDGVTAENVARLHTRNALNTYLELSSSLI